MAKINNESVNIGDKVYDITQGWGTVTAITLGDIIVKFKNGLRITYDTEGNYGGIRRLFWDNPIVVEPTKDQQLWNTLKSCVLTIHSFLAREV